jgi:hypothetical protein
MTVAKVVTPSGGGPAGTKLSRDAPVPGGANNLAGEFVCGYGKGIAVPVG